jgi:septal ring factor EnvC (AmiA/AmiB activator)
VPRTLATEFGVRPLRGALACGALLCLLVFAAQAGAAGSTDLQVKVEAARGQASALASDLRAKQSELAAAQSQAAAAAAHEEQLSALLATGQARAAALSDEVVRSQRRLVVEKGRLHRARRALAERLVAIYESGSPSTASVVLASSNFDDLAARTEYLTQIENSDSSLAQRVEGVRDEVRNGLARVATLKAQADAYDARLAEARSQISAVRQSAETSASQLQSLASAREASLSSLKSQIGNWVSEIQAARAAAAQRATESEAQAEVDRWLGGPYSIPAYIVICESGGNYSAVNPSSGAGGAYQILPSTWQLYGGKGDPQDAPKAEQDSIAAQIWADSGPGAWVCG